MPERPIIADTGPLVALLLESEPRHVWTEEQLRTLPAPLFTCEPVLTETFHFLRHTKNGTEKLFEMLDRGLLIVDFDLTTETKSLRSLMRKYSDLPMSLADACLVRMAEIQARSAVLTLDRHFKVYRKHGREPITILTPDD